MAKTTKRQIKFLEEAEVHHLIASIVPRGYRGLRDRALMEVLFSTGLRIHEALALLRKDFTDTKGGTKELTIIGKGGWQRVVFFSRPALAAVKAWLDYRKDDEPEVFPMTSRAAQIMIKRRARAARFDKRVTPHIFRHSLATDLLNKGVDIRVVQEFLGHRSISSTQVYTHVTNKQLKDIHTKLYK